ncbi:hypothetical protein EV363DRAFT_1426556 [Boletus edulis]|nr:hypothetical protein EV363DRAFT_1426556 [Boletus edulis]
MTPDSIPPLDVSYLQNPLPDSVPVNHHPLNPISYLLRAALVYPDKLALAHPDAEQPAFYSYSVWAQRVQNLAYALIQAGIRPGDRVAVLAPNSPMIADAHFGVIAARAILTPINTRLTPLEIAYILEHSEAKLILVDHECLHLIPHTNVTTIVCHDTSKPGDPYEDFLSAGRKFSSERGWAGLDVEPNEHASAVLCYTSGTTGRVRLDIQLLVCSSDVSFSLKGSSLLCEDPILQQWRMPLRQESITSPVIYGTTLSSPWETFEQWTVLSRVLPMFHAAGWTFPWANVFACATQITIRQVDYPQIWKHLLNSGVTHYCGAPTVQIGIVNDASKQPLRNPVSAIVAGSAPTAQLISQLEQIGIKPVHTYGPFTRYRAKLMARQGQSFATAENVRVVYPPKHEDDQELIDVPKDGSTVGEIVTRGNIVMKEEATRKAFRGGYFNSGDLAVMHPDGVVQIMDRKKDIIISGGENASSLAIELELANHPHILEVSVVARPHPKWDERPMAFVILRPQYVQTWAGNHAAFEVELKRHARTRLPGFASPEWVQVVDKLPKTSTGKILKTDLRKIVAKL